MTPRRHTLPPLDRKSLDRLALRYVERYATTRAKLAAYLHRKIRERGWDGPPAAPEALAERFATLGYVDDRAFAEARVRAMSRRGLGKRRIADALRGAGIAAEDAAAVTPTLDEQALESALTLARRKRIGPFAEHPVDRERRARHLAQMIRGGHAFALSRRIVEMAPGDDVETLYVE